MYEILLSHRALHESQSIGVLYLCQIVSGSGRDIVNNGDVMPLREQRLG